MTLRSDLTTYRDAIGARLAALTLQESTSDTDYDGHRRSLLNELAEVQAAIVYIDGPFEHVTESGAPGY